MAQPTQRAEDEPAADGSDPYVRWAWGPGRRYYFPPGQRGRNRMPLLLQIKGMRAQEFVEGRHFFTDERARSEWRASFLIVSPDMESAAETEAVSWLAALVTREISDTIASEKVRPFVQGVSLGRPLDDRLFSMFEEMAKTELTLETTALKSAETEPKPVIMGIIDDGIAFAHERFRTANSPADKTRVQYAWIMDPPGTFLTEAMINALLTAHTDASEVLNEEGFYRDAGLIDFTQKEHKSAAWRISHGTHVMDLACGFDRTEKRSDRPIVCVQVRTQSTANMELQTANGNLELDVALALYFIVGICAPSIAAKHGVAHLPVVINLSYGLLAGPHDGTRLLEQLIDWWVAWCKIQGFPLRVVLPAGNSHQSRVHARFKFEAKGQKECLNWRILPDDRTESFLEIWLPVRDMDTPSRLKVTVMPPTGGAHVATEDGPSYQDVPVAAPHYGALAVDRWLSGRTRFVVLLAPTAHPSPHSTPTATFAPAGAYKIQLECTHAFEEDDEVFAWVARDDRLFGFPELGRQSFLDDGKYERVDHYSGREVEIDSGTSTVRRERTINSIATGDSPAKLSPIVMGGFLRKEMSPARYTARGAVVSPPRSPEAMAPSEDSRVHAGILAAGSRSGSTVPLGGTSVAAPQIAKVVADKLAGGVPVDRSTVQGLATNVPPTTIPPQPDRHGTGRIGTDPVVKLKRYEWP